MASGGPEDAPYDMTNVECRPSAKKNRKRRAVKYCVQCEGHCCRPCADRHNVLPALERHQLHDQPNFILEDMTPDVPEVSTIKCNIHKQEAMDMYCGNHDVVRCKLCMALRHRSCVDVQVIPDGITNIFKKADADKTITTLEDKIKQLEKIVNTRTALLKELKKSKTEATKAVKQFRKEMELLLKSLEKESLKQVEEEYRKKECMLEEEKKKAKNEMENIKKTNNEVVQQEENKSQTFIKIKIAQESVARADELISSLEVPSDSKITFQVDTDIKDILRQLNSLGKVMVRSSTAYEPRSSVYSIHCNSDINIRLPNDATECHLFGSCSTEIDMILFTEQHRQNLKRIYVSDMSLVDQCNLLCMPHFVCTTSEQEVAVTFNNKTIQFVSLGNKMIPTRQMTLSHTCLGIAYKDNKLFTTDGQSSLYIHDMEGNMLRTVSQESSGDPLFTHCRQIAISDTVERLFVVDWSNTVTTLDIQGNHIDTLTDSDLSYASDICTDSRGNVFVCGNGSSRIVQIGQDGRKKGVIATAADGIVNPLSICFDPKRCILYVTLACRDTVKALHLK